MVRTPEDNPEDNMEPSSNVLGDGIAPIDVIDSGRWRRSVDDCANQDLQAVWKLYGHHLFW